jgi:hypothetical protein
MGLGGPIGGLITDWYITFMLLECSNFNSINPFRLGWRWAFLIQFPLFLLSLFLTTCNLTYVTPVRSRAIFFPLELTTKLKGSGRSAKDVLKRIDYGGSLSLLGAVSGHVS